MTVNRAVVARRGRGRGRGAPRNDNARGPASYRGRSLTWRSPSVYRRGRIDSNTQGERQQPGEPTSGKAVKYSQARTRAARSFEARRFLHAASVAPRARRPRARVSRRTARIS